MDNIFTLIRKWAEDRNLIKGSDSKSQYLKLMSEFGELSLAIIEHDRIEQVDGIGDTLVVLTIICAQNDIEIPFSWLPPHAVLDHEVLQRFVSLQGRFGMLGDAIAKGQKDKLEPLARNIVSAMSYLASSLEIDVRDALKEAYNSIKDRKGVMYNGVFVKSDDPRYEGILQELGQKQA